MSKIIFLQFKKLPFSSRTVTFWGQYLGNFEVQNPSLWAACTCCCTFGSYHSRRLLSQVALEAQSGGIRPSHSKVSQNA